VIIIVLCLSIVERAGLISSDANYHTSLSAAELYIQCHDVITHCHRGGV